jgi:TolB-like protein
MNARVELVDCDSDGPLASDEIRGSVRELLTSAAFAKAPRMCDLLCFLIDKKLDGRESEITEYAIGMEVFRRDARSYDTTLDPVVRVQIGRLRGRLTDYYAARNGAAAVHITIPSGNYIPTFRRAAANAPAVFRQRLELAPLRDLTPDSNSTAFVCGVDEELCSRIFAVFGDLVQLRDERLGQWPGNGTEARPQCRLEGSIRVEKKHVRASMRLVDTQAGHTAWASQFDCTGELGMALQEELAIAICDKLQRHLDNR